MGSDVGVEPSLDFFDERAPILGLGDEVLDLVLFTGLAGQVEENLVLLSTNRLGGLLKGDDLFILHCEVVVGSERQVGPVHVNGVVFEREMAAGGLRVIG